MRIYIFIEENNTKEEVFSFEVESNPNTDFGSLLQRFFFSKGGFKEQIVNHLAKFNTPAN